MDFLVASCEEKLAELSVELLVGSCEEKMVELLIELLVEHKHQDMDASGPHVNETILKPAYAFMFFTAHMKKWCF